jgi:hypothetical protein
MRFYKSILVSLVIVLLTLAGCGGGGGGGATPPAADTLAPTVSISTPTNNATVSGIAPIQANASDNVGVTKVEFYVNGVLNKTVISAPFTFNWDTSSLAKGSYTLLAKAYDAANNVGQSSSVVVTVPITATMSTVITGSTAVGAVLLAGLSTPDALGLNVAVTSPAGATIASAVQSGVAVNAFSPFVNGQLIILAGSSGFGSGEVMKISFANVPAGAVPADFSVTLSAVFGAGGVQIQ